ncbi:hypothetical protein PENNAL_c0109G00426 [Penicillium nalgiovense]|uniref:Uncharacterized protein n=1 Tax=Penicillium nalgiovense TaxID=60175 RepID=A0A1V6X7P2_PENNA|nr:hypothetical protein PENNAL_c0109G00426 [Penicillium nalgiovense]
MHANAEPANCEKSMLFPWQLVSFTLLLTLEVGNMDQESIRRLCHFGLYNEDYAKAKGLEPFSSHEGSAGLSLCWDWSMSQSLAERSDAIAAKLAEQSSHKFSHIPFTEFVRRAYGLPSPAIEDSLRAYDFIESKIYSTFTRNLQHLGLLVELKQSLKEIDADPFLYAAIKKALQRVVLQRKPHVPLVDENLENGKPELDERLQWIIEPLQRLLQTPDTARNILSQLEILEKRFYKLYRSSEASWGPFNTDTSFFGQVQWIDVSEFANALSRKDKVFFSQYIEDALFAKDDHARRVLNTRWNDLSVAVEECMVADVDVSGKIDHLAKELYCVRNYYSLTAIIQGIKASGLHTEALGDFGYLIDSENNYERYRRRVNTGPGMEFFYPALSAAVRGNFTFADEVIDRFARYNVEDSCFGR